MEEALRQLKEKQPNVLLIDYKLKGPATGLDFLKTVRATHPAIPALMITGLTDQVETLREQCRQAGICAFFQKPLRMDQVLVAVKQTLNP